MGPSELSAEALKAIEQVLGYLNFSSGTADPKLLANLNILFAELGDGEEMLASGQVDDDSSDVTESPSDSDSPKRDTVADHATWKIVGRALAQSLQSLKSSSTVFADSQQADAVLDLIVNHVLPGYQQYHRDLLAHQSERDIFNSFFMGRVCEATLQQGGPWEETDRIVDGAIRQLNDYIGHRPIPSLENQTHQAYPHEYSRPVPIFVKEAGAAEGQYKTVMETAWKMLSQTDEDLLRAAYFDVDRLEELAFDARSYDFEHPVNKRPNYHFGQWDPHHIDGDGFYTRFVVQKVSLDALMQRVLDGELEHEEAMFEAGAVLAGVVLMASGVSGSGPDSHDSDVTLASMLPRIAKCRDEFYQRLIDRLDGKHGDRLRQEAVEKHQPFGAARQHLNAQLSKYRAAQLEHMQVARIFARMGFPEAAAKHAGQVPVPAARIQCEIDCRLAYGQNAIRKGDLVAATGFLSEVEDLLERGIECGAIIDPWSILGFDANFSLFPALENSVRDHRADELVDLMERIFTFYSQVWSAAAAEDQADVCAQTSTQFEKLASWWRRFAAHEVGSVETTDAMVIYDSARLVADALNLWHKGGAAAGNIKFWAPHAAMFDSPSAYRLVINALLERKDLVASMALLIHWLGQADRVGMEAAETSFHAATQRWLAALREETIGKDPTPEAYAEFWSLACKFYDYLEANAESYWHPPGFELGFGSKPESPPAKSPEEDLFAGGEMEEEEDEEDALFSAAYEDVVYRDSTDDGVDGAIFEPSRESEDELDAEYNRINDSLNFLGTLAEFWRFVSIGMGGSEAGQSLDESLPTIHDTFSSWLQKAASNFAGLNDLIKSVSKLKLSPPTGDHNEMLEYDRRRMIKESLLDRVIHSCVETSDAARLLFATVNCHVTLEESPNLDHVGQDLGWTVDVEMAIPVFTMLMKGDRERVEQHLDDLFDELSCQPLLYVPLARGGDPAEIVGTRVRQRTIQDLLVWLPRQGFLVDTCDLLETARAMEQENPVGAGAVTEFDELFRTGYQSLVESIVKSSHSWNIQAPPQKPSKKSAAANEVTADNARSSALVATLEQLTETMLMLWLAHSRTLRLSVVEKIYDKRSWSQIVAFIEKYGSDLFTQRFLNLGNLRAILHQGVDSWFRQLKEYGTDETHFALLDDLDDEIAERQAADFMTIILEAVVENYGEYRDYNSTTTQSDRGELLYMFLDFLRLRTKYDRVCWNLRPVIVAHDILVRQGEDEAAQMWRRALKARIDNEAQEYLKRLARLQQKYGMRMPSIAERIGEQFIKPLTIDRVTALVRPSMVNLEDGEPNPEFQILEHEVDLLTREPTGAGLDLPAWLAALDEELEIVRHELRTGGQFDLSNCIPQFILSYEQTQEQLDEWSSSDQDAD